MIDLPLNHFEFRQNFCTPLINNYDGIPDRGAPCTREERSREEARPTLRAFVFLTAENGGYRGFGQHAKILDGLTKRQRNHNSAKLDRTTGDSKKMNGDRERERERKRETVCYL